MLGKLSIIGAVVAILTGAGATADRVHVLAVRWCDRWWCTSNSRSRCVQLLYLIALDARGMRVPSRRSISAATPGPRLRKDR
jgi:hypothetical protein